MERMIPLGYSVVLGCGLIAVAILVAGALLADVVEKRGRRL